MPGQKIKYSIGTNQYFLNPFAPEPPIIARAYPGPFYPL